MSLTLLVASISVIAVQCETFEADDERQPITVGEEASSVPLTDDNQSYQPDQLIIVTSMKSAVGSASEKGALFTIDGDRGTACEEHRYNVYDDVDFSPVGQYTLMYDKSVAYYYLT